MAENRGRTKVPLGRKDLYSLVDDDTGYVEDSYLSKHGWSRLSRETQPEKERTTCLCNLSLTVDTHSTLASLYYSF